MSTDTEPASWAVRGPAASGGLRRIQREGESAIGLISRDLEELMSQTIGHHRQYPDGVVLLSGTMFAPTQDRHEPGQGHTHEIGDVVSTSNPRIGTLINEVNYSHLADPWQFGIAALTENLAERNLI